MKLSKALLVPSFLGVARSASPSAALFTFECPNTSSSSSTQLQTVSPEAARLILARRLGLSQFHRLRGLADVTLQQINDFGGYQQQLLSDNINKSKVMIVVEGVEDISDFTSQSQKAPSFYISNPPTSSANGKLLHDLISQSRSLSLLPERVLDVSSDAGTFTASIILDENRSSVLEECKSKIADVKRGLRPDAPDFDFLQALTAPEIAYWCGPTKTVMHFTYLQKLAKQEGTSSNIYKDAARNTWSVLSRLAAISEKNDVQSTVILMPHSTRNAKRAAQPYGAYTLPVIRSIEPRFSETEVPLSDIEEPAKASPSPQEDTAAKSTKGFLIFNGPIASCYLSKDECVSATRSCSGRATCYLKYNSGQGEKGRDCWKCGSCKPTVEKVKGGGTQTTYWGGAACQKQDVSVPFLLLTGFSVLLVGGVTWGIGLLYSIGQEQLPGVLGAGVTATRPR